MKDIGSYFEAIQVKPPISTYRDFTIRKWTGWKGNNFILEESDHLLKEEKNCSVCGKPFKAGDRVVLVQGIYTMDHFDCSSEPLKGQIISQWLAYTGDEKDEHTMRYVYASVPGAQGEYKRGGNFDVLPKEGQKALFPDTPITELFDAIADGFVRLKRAIDEIQDGS